MNGGLKIKFGILKSITVIPLFNITILMALIKLTLRALRIKLIVVGGKLMIQPT